MWSEGGRGSRAHSPELIVACVLAHVIIVTRVLVVAHVRSWALAAICEPRWPFWLVIHVRRGSRSSVGGRHHLWAVDGGGDCSRQWAIVVVGGGCERLVMVGGGGVVVCVRGLSFFVAVGGCCRMLLFIVRCRMSPVFFFCEKRGGTGDLLLTVSVNHRSLFVIVVIGDMAPGYHVNKGKRERRGLPEFMWTVTTICVVTVWTTWHVC